jgi:hypothetical protein
MNIQRQNWLINRRHVLRGIGVSLALPLLECMRPLRASAAEKLATAKRSVFVYLPNGVNILDYQITQAGANYKFSKSLESLEKHRSLITPISGLYHPNGLGHNHRCYNIWLTGAKIGETERSTISVDQLMAQQTAPDTRFPSLELSDRGVSLAWNSDGIQLPAQSKASVVFSELFEDKKGGLAAQRRGLKRRGSILDVILEDAHTLESGLGQNDRGRLEQYLTAVREVEVRTKREDGWLDTPRPTVDPVVQSHVNRDVSQSMVGDYFRTMYDLIVLAFQTDLTRVVTFSTGLEVAGLPIPEIGINHTRHSLSHHSGRPEFMKGLTESDAFNIKQFSYFLDRLSEVKDDDGPLIDTTMVMYGSGMANGNTHGNANLPIILAGGGKLGIKHGTHVDFNVGRFEGYDLANPDKQRSIYHKPLNSKAHLSNLLLTMAQKMGVETETFADSLGTISEVQA